MLAKTAAGAKNWHGKASRWAGKFGNQEKLPGSIVGGKMENGKIVGGAMDQARRDAIDARGQTRVNVGLGLGAATMVTRKTRNSSGRDGLSPHSMGGTTL